MPRAFISYLQQNNIYVCKKCNTHITSLSSLIATTFTGASGVAYLFNQACNVYLGNIQKRHLKTGLHQTAYLYCNGCRQLRNAGKNKEEYKQIAIGWKYIKAYEQDQKYKESKYILQIAFLAAQQWIDKGAL